MNAIIDIISDITGGIMKVCYFLAGNYGISLILFTLLTKVILFPVNILIQKNSIKMAQMQPQLEALKNKFFDDKDKLADEQLALYKRNHYHTSLNIIPVVIQLLLIFGLLGAVYNPMTYLLDVSENDTEILKKWLVSDMGVTDAGSTAELEVIRYIQNGSPAPDTVSSETVSRIKDFDIEFCGINLGQRPSLKDASLLLVIPFLAGLSALAMCAVQNRINVLQLSAGKLNRYGVTVFMIAFSSYFAFLVPAGVGVYWICGNLFSIPSMLLLNAVIPPGKYVNIDEIKRARKSRENKEAFLRKHAGKEKADYKRFMSVADMRLMFYSESNGFYKYYAGLIDYICENSDIDIHYVTSDPDDKIFDDKRAQIHAYYCARDKYLIPLFMKLDCDMCIMTVPDLEKFHIKRSRVRKDIEYVYICHGMGSNALTLRKGALDHYDTMFCVGIDSENEVRDAEELYGTKKKTLIEAGYMLLDDMLADYEKKEHKKNDPPIILIAPSWHEGNIAESCVTEIIDSLLGGNYEIILRPHPQMVRHNPEKFDILKEKYKGTKAVIQTDFSSNNPVLEADLLITDWSDISFEYAFTTKRPVLFVDTPMKIMNPEYDRIKTKPINITLRSVIGKSVSPENAADILKTADELIGKREFYREQIEKTLHEHIFNVGNSRKIYGKYVLKRLKAAPHDPQTARNTVK